VGPPVRPSPLRFFEAPLQARNADHAKILSAHFSDNAEMKTRFEREAQRDGPVKSFMQKPVKVDLQEFRLWR